MDFFMPNKLLRTEVQTYYCCTTQFPAGQNLTIYKSVWPNFTLCWALVVIGQHVGSGCVWPTCGLWLWLADMKTQKLNWPSQCFPGKIPLSQLAKWLKFGWSTSFVLIQQVSFKSDNIRLFGYSWKNMV